MVMYDNEFETKEKKIWTKDKIEPQHIHIFPFFREFKMFSIENFKIISNFGPLQRISRMTKHVNKAGKVDPGDMGH